MYVHLKLRVTSKVTSKKTPYSKGSVSRLAVLLNLNKPSGHISIGLCLLRVF